MKNITGCMALQNQGAFRGGTHKKENKAAFINQIRSANNNNLRCDIKNKRKPHHMTEEPFKSSFPHFQESEVSKMKPALRAKSFVQFMTLMLLTSSAYASSEIPTKVTGIDKTPSGGGFSSVLPVVVYTLATLQGSDPLPAIALGALSSMLPEKSASDAELLLPSAWEFILESANAGPALLTEFKKEILRRDLEQIAHAPGQRDGRRKAIEDILVQKGFSREQMIPKLYRSVISDPALTHSWEEPQSIPGVNLQLNVNNDTLKNPTILIGAHYDRTEQGTGAVDNASGCIAAIELACFFRDHPLAGHKVQVVFFDQEEEGAVGSYHFVEQCLKDNTCPEFAVSLDGLANGDVFFVAGQDSSHKYFLNDPPKSINFIERKFIESLTRVSLKHPVINNGATLWSDNLPFQHKGIASVGVMMMSSNDPNAVKALQDLNAERYRLPVPGDPNDDVAMAGYRARMKEYEQQLDVLRDNIHFLNVIHTASDTVEQVDIHSLWQNIQTIKKAIERFDT